LTYNVTNIQGRYELRLAPTNNFAGPVSLTFYVSYNSNWSFYEEYGLTPPAYAEQYYTFVFGDSPIGGRSQTITALAGEPLSNVPLARFTNGVPGSLFTNFSAAVNWGDDTTNTGIVTANAAGEKAVLGSHTYQYPGTYPVYVQVQSYLGTEASILSYVTVTNQAVPATNLFTMQIIGQGTVSPADTNAVLNVGDSYSVSAASTGTWVFASWTDDNGFVLGTSTNLTFTMSQGLSLTATFVQATAPSLTIVSPANGQVITNLYSASTTITGTATNNATVTSVWYQVNSGAWQQASGTTNWSANFSPAFNVSSVLNAYAINNFGYVSTTNTVLVKYLAGDVLTLNTNGLGSITPALGGQLLPFGTNYTLTAHTNVGFAFQDWSGSASTNKPTLVFTMTSNLVFTANFLETAKPALAISAPTNHQKMTNAVAFVVGTATDDWGVQGVWLQLNNNPWALVSTDDGYTNWTTALTLTAGTNILKTFALNLGGIYSATNTLSILSSNTFNLQLTFSHGQPLSATGLAFNLEASAWLSGLIQYSTNLTDWTTLTNFAGTNSVVSFLDPAATNSHERFYRAMIP